MSRKQLLERLDTLINKVGDDHKKIAQAAVKTASPGDGAEDGTKAVETGAQMASNKAEAAKGTKAMVDGGAKTNPAGASLEMSTDGATAVSTDGQKGTEGADLEVKHQAANGPEGGIKGDDKTAALVSELRKAASALEANEKKASAKPDTTKAEAKLAEILNKKAAAPARELSALEKFLVQEARANNKVANDIADPAAADQQTDGLLQAIQSGQMSEEQAEQMLLQLVQQGVISEQELTQAMQEMHGAGAGAGAAPTDPAAAGAAGPGAAGAAAPMAPPAAPAADPAAAGGEMVEDPALEAKMAMANIGPENPLYLQKIATLYPEATNAGYAYAVKLAEGMIGDNVEDGTKDAEGGIEAPKVQKAELKPAEGEAVGTKAEIDNNAKKDLPADKGEKKAEALPPMHGGDSAPSAHHGAPAATPDAMSDQSAVLAPKSPEEQAALEQVLNEMGLTMDDLKHLMAQKGHQHSDPAAAKVAAAKTEIRKAILNKVAELQDTVAAK